MIPWSLLSSLIWSLNHLRLLCLHLVHQDAVALLSKNVHNTLYSLISSNLLDSWLVLIHDSSSTNTDTRELRTKLHMPTVTKMILKLYEKAK